MIPSLYIYKIEPENSILVVVEIWWYQDRVYIYKKFESENSILTVVEIWWYQVYTKKQRIKIELVVIIEIRPCEFIKKKRVPFTYKDYHFLHDKH